MDIFNFDRPMWKLKRRRVIIAFLLFVFSFQCVIGNSNVFSSVNRYTIDQRMFSKEDTVYTIRENYDLKGNEITFPKGCVLRFEGGCLRNGTIIGKQTTLQYDNPFLNNVLVKGEFETNKVPMDTEIFIDSNYNGNRIKSLMNIYGVDEKIIFAANEYSDVEAIELKRNIDIDFSGSILRMKLDSYGLPDIFIYVNEKDETSGSYLDFFKLSNVTIIGNEQFKYDGTLKPATTHNGPHRRCVQLFKVDEVIIDNVNFYHIEVGTQGDYHMLLRQRYELSVVSIMYYNHAIVNGCTLHDCTGDNLIYMVPNVRDDNMAVISNCRCFRNYTGLVLIHDGRCKVYGNDCVDCNSSVMNLFCYDSEVYSNHFENTYTDCIDLSEVGRITSHNVKIYDNTANGIADFCGAWGKDIYVYNNTIKCATPEGFAVNTFTMSKPWMYNDSKNNKQDFSYISCYITNNNIKGNITRSSYGGGVAVKNGNVIDYLLIENNVCERDVASGVDNSANPICLTNVRRALIRNNHIKGFSKVRGTSRYMSFWQLYETPTDEEFVSLIDFDSNTFEYEKGAIDDDVTVLLGAEYDTGKTNKYKVRINYLNNIIKPVSGRMVDFIKLGNGQTDISIYATGNSGIIKSKLLHF